MSDNQVSNILIVGVGGQGIILASDVLGRVAARAGYDVKKNEIHGMAQRGGSVSSHVRFGKSVSSPIIKLGEAEVLLSFEQLETVRYFPFLAVSGKVIVNDHKILPPAVFTGKQDYPEDILEKIKEKVPDAMIVDGMELATRLGVSSSPTLVFFDERGREIIRIDSVVGFYRLNNVLRFVLTKGYLETPNFQVWRQRNKR